MTGLLCCYCIRESPRLHVLFGAEPRASGYSGASFCNDACLSRWLGDHEVGALDAQAKYSGA